MDTELLKGTLSLLILSLLTRKPMYGYELAATVRLETDGALRWTEGSLYPSLHKLEKEGLITGQWQGKTGSRQRKYYQLTEAGRAASAEKINCWNALCSTINHLLEKCHE